jgi:hypothetical protein
LVGWRITRSSSRGGRSLWSLRLLAVALQTGARRLSWLALLPALVFWGLDAYYLRQERAYRKLYDDARSGAVEPFSMDASAYAATPMGWLLATMSWTVAGVHGVAVAVVIVFLKISQVI